MNARIYERMRDGVTRGVGIRLVFAYCIRITDGIFDRRYNIYSLTSDIIKLCVGCSLINV
jgi:hypothetical protein